MNSKSHLTISIMKSVLRVLSCAVSLITNSLIPLSIGFIFAELFGIVEELVDKR